MNTVTLSGASDDLIELEGDIYDEWDVGNNPADLRYVAFSDGTLASIAYTQDGTWRINLLNTGPGTQCALIACPPGEDDPYTDRLTIITEAPIVWAACTALPPALHRPPR